MKIVLVSAALSGFKCLEEMILQKVDIAAVFTLKDELTENVSGFVSFDEITKKNNIPLFKVEKVSSPENVEKLKEMKPDLIFVIGFSQLIPKEILSTPTKGCIGMHPTLLPEHRGRAPIPWTIIHGLKKSGATMFYLDEGADSGDIIGQVEFEVADDEIASSLYDKVVEAFVKLVHDNLPLLIKGEAKREKQDESKASYWEKRTPKDGLIDWSKSVTEIWTLVRAVTHPYPGAFSNLGGKKLTIWQADVCKLTCATGSPGLICEHEKGFCVKCGEGCLLVKRAQFGEDSEEDAINLIKEKKLSIGDMLGG